MCGIVGYVGNKEAAPILLNGLKRLEYRGYDSAGIAVKNGVHFSIKRAEGKLSNLVSKVAKDTPVGSLGIGHTRWATHGKPTETNAHPHHAGRVVLVHNGIIENYLKLKENFLKGRKILKSETDTEIICHVIEAYLQKGVSFLEAFQKALQKLEGTYALVVMDLENPGQLYVAKKSSPLIIGVKDRETFVASDIPAILPFTKKIIYLDDGETAVLKPGEVTVYDSDGRILKKEICTIKWSPKMAEKGGYKHFMLKEIMEQPRVMEETILGRIQKGKQTIYFPDLDKLFKSKKFPSFNRFYMVACGTSWHAAMAGKYLIESIAKIPVSVDTASEFRYREPFIDKKTLLLVISQSGETADTLACMDDAKKRGAKVIAICNVLGSSITRKSNVTLDTRAGPEIGVASTKAFTTQMVQLFLLSLYLALKNKTIDATYVQKAIKQLNLLPSFMEKMLAQKEVLYKMAQKLKEAHDIYYIARGVHYPIALEGALKLKEISYIHAEGYSAGEMKHGPIALIEKGTPVVAIAPDDRVCGKMISNIEEVKARGASVFTLATEGDHRFDERSEAVFYLPRTQWYLAPILAVVPLQLLAYFVADLKGCDIDQPRNLAKSVTVE
ncbi:MAG: glutamine--fructose-6-phosphate aminotransferase [Deltaproteobacteria bacterium GWA2_45_12]|nr:MAG: glutamine--fructose-6-phosphate aminotransferase [Deltaproteobacteria bacterium GWA2_45_12]